MESLRLFYQCLIYFTIRTIKELKGNLNITTLLNSRKFGIWFTFVIINFNTVKFVGLIFNTGGHIKYYFNAKDKTSVM